MWSPVMKDAPDEMSLDEGQRLIKLPRDHWALLCDPENLTNSDRKKVARTFDDTKGGQSTKGLAAVDKLLSLFVVDWSWDAPVPSTPSSLGVLDQLPIRLYDELCAAVQSHAEEIFPDFNPNPAAASPS